MYASLKSLTLHFKYALCLCQCNICLLTLKVCVWGAIKFVGQPLIMRCLWPVAKVVTPGFASLELVVCLDGMLMASCI